MADFKSPFEPDCMSVLIRDPDFTSVQNSRNNIQLLYLVVICTIHSLARHIQTSTRAEIHVEMRVSDMLVPHIQGVSFTFQARHQRSAEARRPRPSLRESTQSLSCTLLKFCTYSGYSGSGGRGCEVRVLPALDKQCRKSSSSNTMIVSTVPHIVFLAP
jgi:hypothetical protein